MLVELETGLVALIKASALAPRLRLVDSLPDLSGDSLIGRFVSDAPAVYVAMGSFPVKSGYARPQFGVACVARNSRSQQAARHGDGIQIGLQQMLDAVLSLMEGALVGEVAFEVTNCEQIASEALYQKGVYAGVVQIRAVADVPIAHDLGDLADFKTFHADFDVEPHEPGSEHDKWLAEPPDHSSSAPELADTLTLQP